MVGSFSEIKKTGNGINLSQEIKSSVLEIVRRKLRKWSVVDAKKRVLMRV